MHASCECNYLSLDDNEGRSRKDNGHGGGRQRSSRLSPTNAKEEGGGEGEPTRVMMITTMPIVLRMQVQGGGGRRCCLPWQSRRNVSILSVVDTTDNDDGKLVVKQPKGKENNADYRPRH